MTMKLDSQIVGNAGLYFTCYRLSLLGCNAMPAAATPAVSIWHAVAMESA